MLYFIGAPSPSSSSSSSSGAVAVCAALPAAPSFFICAVQIDDTELEAAFNNLRAIRDAEQLVGADSLRRAEVFLYSVKKLLLAFDEIQLCPPIPAQQPSSFPTQSL